MTISYNQLGSNGGLGNQMFQYAALRGISFNNNYHWIIPEPKSYGTSNYGLFECFEMSSVTQNNIGELDAQSVFTGTSLFNEYFFNNCPDNVNLHDYFQTEKYFKNVETIIRKDFTFKKEILNSCFEVFQDLKNPIFIHVRRGDYLELQDYYNICDVSYYENGLSNFSEDCNVLIFSDDVEWCKEQNIFKDDRFMISDFKIYYQHKSFSANRMYDWLIPYYDLCLMSLCNGGIIANSSLSWWGAWLQNNLNKKIIAPKKWFGPKNIHIDTTDLYCEGWVLL